MTHAAPSEPSGSAETRSGYVTLLGRPNSGKSTLLNAFLGEPLSIVTPKAQTTWRRVTGVLTTGDAQMIFLDTPGLLHPRDLLQRSMLATAHEALAEADVLLLVLDASRPLTEVGAAQIQETVGQAPPGCPLLAAINKIDLAAETDIRRLAHWVEEVLRAEAFPVSALLGTGVEALEHRLVELLPRGPFLYPADELSSEPLRFFAAELIRETVFEQFEDEIPYSVSCRIEEFREEPEPVYILAQLYVERKSQKGILIGRGGSSIRKLGTEARRKIERLLNRPVYLELWVKILPNWRRRRAHLRRLGFKVPPGDSSDEEEA